MNQKTSKKLTEQNNIINEIKEQNNKLIELLSQSNEIINNRLNELEAKTTRLLAENETKLSKTIEIEHMAPIMYYLITISKKQKTTQTSKNNQKNHRKNN